MKLKYIIPVLFLTFLMTSCSSDDDDTVEVNEVEGLIKIQEITNDTHTIEFFNESGEFRTGYNAVSLRIKDNATNVFIENADVSWMPMMQMPTMQHSCPKSAITKVIEKNTVYEGFVIYQMTNDDGSGWSLTVDYIIDNNEYTASSTISVQQNENQNLASFMGNDGKRYVLAMIEPVDPIIGINSLKVGLFKMENMMTFPEVLDYTIALDPRMPGMGNHTSPNNTDLSYNFADKMYYGDLSLTMTGYWVLNLKLINTANDVLKGEDITDDHEQSSLYLELEF